MFNRQAVVERWRKLLAESESLSDEPPSRSSFYHRVRVRLYRFLLACYGSGQWRMDESAGDEDGESPQPSSAMPLVEPRAVGGQTPESRRVDPHRSGTYSYRQRGRCSSASLSDEPHQPTWIAATADAGIAPKRCCQLLRRRSGQARLVRRGDDVIVEVPRDDLDKALQLIARHRQELRIRDWRETSTTRVGVLVIATLAWLVVVALAIALICSAAAGKAKWGELMPLARYLWSSLRRVSYLGHSPDSAAVGGAVPSLPTFPNLPQAAVPAGQTCGRLR